MIKIEAVLNWRPLTYVSTDDLEEPLTPSHLLLGYRVLSLPDPPLSDDPDYDESANDLSRQMKHLLKTTERFWKRWKEYLLELHEFHCTCKPSKGVQDVVREGQIVTVYDEGQPRGLWRVGRIEGVIPGVDGKIRSARVRVQSKTGRAIALRRPVQHLYPLEIGSQENSANSQSGRLTTNTEDDDTPSNPQSENPDAQMADETPRERPRRSAAVEARDRILGCVTD